MSEHELGLAEAIDAVRAELQKAQQTGHSADVRFVVESVDVELTVELTKTAGGEASVKVLNLLSLGGKGEVAKGETSRVSVRLRPLGVSGATFEVSAPWDHRPDLA